MIDDRRPWHSTGDAAAEPFAGGATSTGGESSPAGDEPEYAWPTAGHAPPGYDDAGGTGGYQYEPVAAAAAESAYWVPSQAGHASEWLADDAGQAGGGQEAGYGAGSDQGYVADQGYGPDQGHAADQGYGPDQGHAADQGYGPDQGYAADQGYTADSGYGPDQGYVADQGYEPDQGYSADLGYGPDAAYEDQDLVYGGQESGQVYAGQGHDGQIYDGQNYDGQIYDGQNHDGQNYDGQFYDGGHDGGQGYDEQGFEGQGYPGQDYGQDLEVGSGQAYAAGADDYHEMYRRDGAGTSWAGTSWDGAVDDSVAAGQPAAGFEQAGAGPAQPGGADDWFAGGHDLDRPGPSTGLAYATGQASTYGAAPADDTGAFSEGIIDLSASRPLPVTHRGQRRKLVGVLSVAALATAIAGGAGYAIFRPDPASNKTTAGPIVTTAPSSDAGLLDGVPAPSADPLTPSASASPSPSASSSPTPTPTSEATEENRDATDEPVATRPVLPLPTSRRPTPAPTGTTPSGESSRPTEAALTASFESDGGTPQGLLPYRGTVVISNPNSSEASGWVVRLTVPGGGAVSIGRGDVSVSQDGESVSFRGAAVPADSSLTFTFTVTDGLTSDPTGCTINGNPCS